MRTSTVKPDSPALSTAAAILVLVCFLAYQLGPGTKLSGSSK